MDLSARPGYLRLLGKQSLGNCFEQALIARRQQAFRFTATTCMDFFPSTFQHMAGLVCYYNGHKYHYLYMSFDQENGRHLAIMSCGGNVSMVARFPLYDLDPVDNTIRLEDDSPVYLRASVDYADLKFSWSLDGSTWRELGILLDYSVISDEAGKGAGNSFTGAFVGVCCQDISGQDQPADFDFFEYVEH